MTRHYLVGDVAYPEANLVAVESGKPVAVIDPEDREQVERLVVAIHQVQSGILGPTTDDVQVALRKLAGPKFGEPTGAGAVIEDANGDWWARLSRGADGAVWHRIGIPECRTNWHQIDAVRKLSDGVTEGGAR